MFHAGSPAATKLESVAARKALVKDVRQLSPQHQRPGGLPFPHSALCSQTHWFLFSWDVQQVVLSLKSIDNNTIRDC